MEYSYQEGAEGGVDRASFIKATYLHLAGALMAFAGVSLLLGQMGVGLVMLSWLGGSSMVWLGFLGAFMLVGWLASSMADKAESNRTQLIGLGLYVLAESLLFAPMFTIANAVAADAIPAAVLITALLVGGLTWTAFTTGKDFSFLGGILKIGGLVAIGTIVAGAIFGFTLGIWFSAIMVVFAGGCVLFDTSRIIHHYPADRPAGAALHLFASIALMLWYVLRILIALSGRD